MTLTNFISDDEGNLINIAHIVRIYPELIFTQENGYEYRIYAQLDCKPENRYALFSSSDRFMEDWFGKQIAREYGIDLFNALLEHLQEITDYQKFIGEFEESWIKDHLGKTT